MSAADDAVIRAERIALGALMAGDPAMVDEVRARLGDGADFWRPSHRVIFGVVADLWRRRIPPDPDSVRAELARLDDGATRSHGIEPIDLTNMVGEVPASAMVGHYVGQVLAAGDRRRTAEALAKAAERITGGSDIDLVAAEVAKTLATRGPGRVTGRRARVTWGTEIDPEPPRWAWDDDGRDLPTEKLATLATQPPFGRLPVGALAIAAGREGTGKSSFGIWLAAHITRGTLPGAFFGTPRRVFYVAVEDSWKHTLMPRMIGAGVDRSMVGRFDVVVDEDTELTLSLPTDLDVLEAEMVRHDVALLVVDPLMSAIGSDIDTHRERDTRTALDPLAKLADRTGAVVLGIAHFSKGSGNDIASLITGSGAFKNVARAIFGFARDQEDGSRIFTQVKNSLGRDHSDLPSMAYVIEDVAVATRSGDAHVGRFRFDGMSDRSASDALTGPKPGSYSVGEATRWLRDYFDECGGSAPSAEVKAAAREDGVTEKILRRARESLGVTAESGGFPRTTTWNLPGESVVPSGDLSGPPSQPTRLGTTAGTGTTEDQPADPGTVTDGEVLALLPRPLDGAA